MIIVMWCGETVTKALLKSFNAFKIAQPALEAPNENIDNIDNIVQSHLSIAFLKVF